MGQLTEIFRGVSSVLKTGHYCVVVVMDIRKQDQFWPFHIDIIKTLGTVGFILDDIIIWDRRKEYNSLRALGYPYVFRVNKVHEYVLVFLKR